VTNGGCPVVNVRLFVVSIISVKWQWICISALLVEIKLYSYFCILDSVGSLAKYVILYLGMSF